MSKRLAATIRSGKLIGAALDVYWPEPPGPDFPLLGLSNVLLTPHLAARTNTAMENMSWVVRDVMEVIQGRPPQFPAPRQIYSRITTTAESNRTRKCRCIVSLKTWCYGRRLPVVRAR